MTDIRRFVAEALDAVDLEGRYAVLRARELEHGGEALDPGRFAAVLRSTGRPFAIESWYLARLSGADEGRAYEFWVEFQAESGADKAEFGMAVSTPHGRIGGRLAPLAGQVESLPFRTRGQLDDVLALALDTLDQLRAVAGQAPAPTPPAPRHGPPRDRAEARELLLDALGAIDFGRRYLALCDPDVGPDERAPSTARQGAALAAAGLEATFLEGEKLFACRTSGTEPDAVVTVNVVVHRTALELSLGVQDVPVGRVGVTFHGAARTLLERAEPGWRHDPPYPRVPFGARRPLEATTSEVAGLIRDVQSSVDAVTWR